MKAHPLARLIPKSNRFDFQGIRDTRLRTTAIENAYHRGFHGCFLDLEEAPKWSQRIASYDEDEFLHDTPGRKKMFSDVFSELAPLEDEHDGQHVYTDLAFQAHERDGKHWFDDPFSVFQNHGICVDSSGKQQTTQMLAVRAMDPLIAEVLAFLAAHYCYAERGFCSHGWTMAAWRTVALQVGWCPATLIEVDGQRLDWDEEDEHEYAVARDWCRSGIPSWLKQWTQANFAWEDGAITRFDGGTDALKRLFANKGVLHHGSNHTSASSTPDRIRRIGGHAQTCCGGDWSDRTLKFFNDLGVRFTKDNFPTPHHQTWGGGWSGEVADKFWPPWWGPKPEGAWITGSQTTLRYFSSGSAVLPLLQGVPSGDEPLPPTPPTPSSRIVVRGELVVEADGQRQAFIVVPKPVL